MAERIQRPDPTGQNRKWFSICSKHSNWDSECPMCTTGMWYTQKEIDAETELFTNDYAEWYRQHNNGEEPTESAWDIWRQLIGKNHE